MIRCIWLICVAEGAAKKFRVRPSIDWLCSPTNSMVVKLLALRYKVGVAEVFAPPLYVGPCSHVGKR